MSQKMLPKSSGPETACMPRTICVRFQKRQSEVLGLEKIVPTIAVSDV